MTKEELIRMANQAFDESSFTDSEVLRFAALVAAAEREACAKVCDEHAKRNYNWASENADTYHAQAHWAARIALAIRARGQE